jgi:sugar phosphate isomerase/epimerase
MKENLTRRKFLGTGSIIITGMVMGPGSMKGWIQETNRHRIRLGGPVPGNFTDPAQWSEAVKSLGYSAAYSPVKVGTPSGLIKAFRAAAEKNNILIAEVGVWNNLLDPDDSARKENLNKNIESLHLAEEIGAKCCVNISGARGEIWDGPYPGNYSDETFDMIVENVRYILDTVRPASAFYTLEPMPYMLPDSPDTYLELIEAIDRKQFAVHLDPVNMISSPQKFFRNAEFIKECFRKLGPYIKSVHAKDIIIRPKLTVHLDECRPGLGSLDYGVLLQELSRLKDTPLMLEHLEKQEDYILAAEYVRKTGARIGLNLAD